MIDFPIKIKYLVNTMEEFIYISTEKELDEAIDLWKKKKVLGIDLECENNLHHYGVYISLFQITDGETNWVVDALTVKNCKKLAAIFEDDKIQKIFHDVSFDLRVINLEYGCSLKNVFDTQIAALLLGEESVGLGSLLEKYLSVTKERKFQRADWTKRPISQEMLSYAVNDTIYLIQLRDILRKKLKDKKRELWLKQELKYIETKKWKYKTPKHSDVKGFKSLTDTQRAIFKRIWLVREKLAKKIDRPVHYLIPNKRLIELSINPPKTISEWKRMRRVHLVVKKGAYDFYLQADKGKKETIELEKVEKKRMLPEQKEEMKKLIEFQQQKAAKLKIQGHLIMNKDQMIEFVVSDNKEVFRPWQWDLIKDAVKKIKQ